MLTVKRWDASRLANVQRTPQGGIRVPSFVTRVGVFVYDLGGGESRRELRPEEEVFSADSLATLRGCTVTDLHPNDPVRADNWKSLAIGHVADNVATDRGMVGADLLIQDAGAVARVDAGERKEISCGYTAHLEMRSGVHAVHGAYDAIQRTIRYNHVAIGPENWGRAGRAVAMQLDSAGAPATDWLATYADSNEEGTTTMKLVIDGKEYDLTTPEGKKVFADLQARAGRCDAAEAVSKKAARTVLETNVRALLRRHKLKIDEGDIATGSDIDLMRALLAKIDPLFDADNPSEEYVRGCIGAAIKNMNTATIEPEAEPVEMGGAPPVVPGTGPIPAAHDSVSARGRKIIVLAVDNTKDGASSSEASKKDEDDSVYAARRRMDEDNRNRWKRKPGT